MAPLNGWGDRQLLGLGVAQRLFTISISQTFLLSGSSEGCLRPRGEKLGPGS